MICIAANDFPEIFSAVQGTGAILNELTAPYVRRAEINGRGFLIADVGVAPEEVSAKTALLIRRFSLSGVMGVGAAVGTDIPDGTVVLAAVCTGEGREKRGLWSERAPDKLYGDPSMLSIVRAASGAARPARASSVPGALDIWDPPGYAVYVAANIMRVPAVNIKGVAGRGKKDYASGRLPAAMNALETALKAIPLLPR